VCVSSEILDSGLRPGRGGGRQVLTQGGGERGMFLLQFCGFLVFEIPGLGQPDFSNIELRELGGASVETGNVIGMSMGCDDDTQLPIGHFGNVIYNSFHGSDPSAWVNAAVDQDVCVCVVAFFALREGKRDQKAIAETNPVHSNANGFCVEFL